LAKAYNTFYADVSILQKPDVNAQHARLLLSQAVADTLKKGMGLLGIEVPERM
jgi:arginyl-tRNA synthetase